jgi:hypothetical protein
LYQEVNLKYQERAAAARAVPIFLFVFAEKSIEALQDRSGIV